VNSIAELARLDSIKDIYEALKRKFPSLDHLIDQAKLAVTLIDEWEKKYQQFTPSQYDSRTRSNGSNESQKIEVEVSNGQPQHADTNPDVPAQTNFIEPFDIVIKNDVVELDEPIVEPQIVVEEESKPHPVVEQVAPKPASVKEYPIEYALPTSLFLVC